MNFASIAQGTLVFVDANIFVYHFLRDAVFASPCDELFERIEKDEIQGFTSVHVLGEAAHRLMAMEAVATFGWAQKGIAQRMARHPTEVKALLQYRHAVLQVRSSKCVILSVTDDLVDAAGMVIQATGLLTNDALVVAVMQAHGLTQLASNDTDFDRVPGLTRFAPF